MISDGDQQEQHFKGISSSEVSLPAVEPSTEATNTITPDTTTVPDQHALTPSDQDKSETLVEASGPMTTQQEGKDAALATPSTVEEGTKEETVMSEDAKPTAMPTDNPAPVGDSTVPTRQAEKDSLAAASAPAIAVDIQGDSGALSDLEDTITSPHGNNAIVERSPGGRYVRFMEKLGSGASKEVYRAYDTQEGIEVAWNVVHLAGVPKTERNRIVNEVRLLERLHHHNIISFHGSWVNREKQQVNFVTEILSSGTLQSFINKVQVIRWKIAKRWARQILTGLEYLHAQDPPVIHRDLKCENIFINGTSGDLRIGDLGLSTVHRNGRALSVLGTPEFMAPDMYEENAYDEKVDIYAFGMCLLEMFTKEIPYRECSNPAQIYKKVTRGDPPDSLRRLKSKHAREFIELCLGTKDENENYIRPSATELMAHPFLQNRPSDDDEVEVDPPMQERVISEMTPSSSSSVRAKSTTSSSPRTKIERRSSSVDEDESDRFEEMPDSETSIRQPKVLVGRGQELQRDEKVLPQSHQRQSSGGSSGDGMSSQQPPPAPSAHPQAPLHQNAQTSAGNSPVTQKVTNDVKSAPPPANSAEHYLVAAAVIEDELPVSQPYEDDTLKLVVTLPVDGQMQNVQFDFHLVEDDPIQVAKEMISDLDIPSEAVLEISETISGLARAARVKQDKYLARQKKQQHGHVRSQSQGFVTQGRPEIIHQVPPAVGHSVLQQSQTHESMQDLTISQAPSVSQPLTAQRGIVTHEQALPSAHVTQPVSQPHGLSSHEQNPQVHAHPPVQQMHMAHPTHLSDAHVVHGQHPPGWNSLAPGQGNGTVSIDPSMAAMQQQQQPQQFQQPSTVPNHAPLLRNVSNQSEIATSSSFPQGGMPQAPVLTQQSNQGVHDSQGQAQSHYAHSSQPQMLQTHQVVQNGTHGMNPISTTVSQYGHSSQSHAQMPPQAGPALSGQTSEKEMGGNFHSSSNEHAAHGQYVANAQHASAQSVSQTPPLPQQSTGQQLHGVQPGNQAPVAYGQALPRTSQTAPAVPGEQPMQQQQQHNMQQASIQQHHPEVGGSQQVEQHLAGGHVGGNQPAGVTRPQSIDSFPGALTTNPIDSRSTQPPNRVGGSNENVITGLSSHQQQNASSGALGSVDTHMNGAHEVPSIELNDALHDELLAAELRKLDEDFKKNMLRAQKVFDTRMDNLQRSQVQREVQHQKTLEKHEKERADFGKRRAQAEIEQSRRIEQLQKDWASRREEMRQKQLAEAQVDMKSSSANASSGAT